MLYRFRRLAARGSRGLTVLIMKSLRRSDYRRWTSANSLEDWWESRTSKLAGLIPAGSRVIEFGAGNRHLEKYLPPGCTYIPSDLVDRGGGTIVLDLNRRPLPDLHHLGANLAVMAGVLEYIADPPSFVEWLSLHFPACVTSYACTLSAPWTMARLREIFARAQYGYFNTYSVAELCRLFSCYEFSASAQNTWNSQVLMSFVKAGWQLPRPEGSQMHS